MTIHLVEDNPQVRELVKSMLTAHYPSARVLGEAEGISDGYELLSGTPADVWLLDIELLDGTVFDLLDRLDPARVENTGMIFLTAYSSYDYVVQALRKSAVEYLLKPVDPVLLCAALDKVREQAPRKFLLYQLDELRNLVQQPIASTHALEKLPVYLSKGVVRYLDLGDVVYLVADGELTHFHLVQDKERPLTSVRNLGFYKTTLLEKSTFKQVSKSCLVNTKFIARFDPSEHQIVLTNGVRITASRRGGQDLGAFFKGMLG
ncbi:MAG: response regulator transcription factor [Saprospiraceae bacterium]|nr:response regulator transcription factor [Saprospiraceae bacterium]